MAERLPSRSVAHRGRPQRRTGVWRRVVLGLLGAGAIAVVVSVIRPAPAPAVTSPPRAVTLPTTPPITSPPSTSPATTPATAATTAVPETAPPTTTYQPPTYTTEYPATTYAPSYSSVTAAPPTTVPPPTTTTTVAPIKGRLPVTPSTLPLTTRKQSGHVDPIFAELSGVGFFIALVLVGVQAVLTRRSSAGRSL